MRRFMTLLRRLIEREGTRYVFEPERRRFPRREYARSGSFCCSISTRVARCAAHARDAFRIVIDPQGEAARAAELGRLVVELQVAPARPLRFLSVRLVQTGSDGLTVQEV
ncbi:MAG: hypothetical protein MZW92_40940 [Comamonadaceae bacterium]|nr:hypothetical protein [Comamonadaceae bacterium]